MKRVAFALLLPIFSICAVIPSIAQANKAEQHAKAFGHLPMFQYAQVSPNGEHIAAVFNAPDGPQIVVSQFGSQELTAILKLKKAQDRIDSLIWANDDRVIVSASYSKSAYGDRFRVSRLFSVSKSGKELQELKPKEVRSDRITRGALYSERVIAILKDDPNHVLVQGFDERDEAVAVYKANVDTGDLDKTFINKYRVNAWVANTQGEVVLGVEIDEFKPGLRHIWHRATESAEWKRIQSIQSFEDHSFEPVFVDGNSLYVLSPHEHGRKALWVYNIASGKFDSLVYAHEKYDVADVIVEPGSSNIIGVRYMDDYVRSVFFNETDNSVFQIVKNSFNGFETSITSLDTNRKKILVSAQTNVSPTKYFWLDLEKKAGGVWFSQYPYLEGKRLPATQKYSFTTSDGVELHGYITLPDGVEKGKAPLVVFPHGGPFGVRDYQYFDPYVQYMASLGYAVMQVNFRGSGGFGSSFENQGYRQWGKRMQQDVYEAIDYVAQQQLADTKNSCMVGASYGGYVALTASFQKPMDFKCIVSIAGIANLTELAEDDYKYKSLRAFISKTIGNPRDDKEKAEMDSLSAIYNLDKIKAPVLLIHGTYDTQVNFSQSDKFYDAAEDADIDIEYVKIKHGTHYFDDGDNRQLMFKELGEFLVEHLK